ncbi:MAG: hypothetical protein WAL80_08155 [Xanthobacteraceae bacterium]
MQGKLDELMQAELNHVPQGLKPFFTKAQEGDFDGQVMMTMSYMAYAYGRAFEEFAVAGLNDWPKKDYIAQPMCFLARHSIELWLKYAIKEYQEFLGDRSASTDHHAVMKLWNALTALRGAAGVEEGDYAGYVGKLLNHLNEIDPDGVACTRFHRHRVRCFEGTGGVSWSDGSLRGSSSLRLCV